MELSSTTGESAVASRNGKELHDATRPFAIESFATSWWHTGTTLLLLITSLVAAGCLSWWPANAAFSMLGGLLFVRAFVLYHDFMHGSILRGSRFGKFLFFTYGLVVLTPPKFWRFSHNFHHANVGKPIKSFAGRHGLLTSDIGSIPLMTVDMFRQATFGQRLRYRMSRHPITILAAYATVFLLGNCLVPLVRNPKKYWDGAVSLVLHFGLIATLWTLAGFPAAFFGFLFPFSIASATGAYLFFAQHNFPGLRILPADQWSHFRAALESSSYLQLNPILNWFTGNIGYHHVHHLNSLIPFYRLPDTMEAIPELQSPAITTLRPRDIISCLRLSLWDESSQRLVRYGQVGSAKSPNSNHSS